MSNILNRPKIVEKAKEVRIANDIIRNTGSLFQQVLRAWENSVSQVWNNDTAAVLAEFGTDAVEIFRISAETAKFLEALKPGSTTAGRALMRPFTAHPDGTITLD